MNWLYSSFVLIVLLQAASTAKILAFLPLPWKSHQFFYRPLLKALAQRGHELDFYTPFPMSKVPQNINQIELTDVLKTNPLTFGNEWTMFGLSSFGYKLHQFIMEKVFEEKSFQDLMQSNTTYDLLLLEPNIRMEPLSYLAHRFSAPFINVAGIPDYQWNNEVAGLPDNPSYVISHMVDRAQTFFERLYNFYVTESLILCAYWETSTKQQELADKYLRYEKWESRPKLTKMISDAALVLMNSHVSISSPYPKPPHMKEVGGIHIDPEPLPKDLQEFMDDAPHGVIYFSLGSVLDPNEMLAGGKFDIFLKIFRSLKQKVMWKVSPEMPKIEDANIKLQTWYPQQSILAHKNVVLFITHGGMQSTVESINFGVPCIGIPGLFDQQRNVKFMVDAGMAIRLSFENLTEGSISWSINEVLTNASYKEAAKFRQNLFMSRPMKPIDEGVYWVEYVLKYGKVLQPASVHMPFYQIYLLDVFAVTLSIVFISFWLLRKLLSFSLLLLFKQSNPGVKTHKVE